MITYETRFVALYANGFGAGLRARVHHRWKCTCGRVGAWKCTCGRVGAWLVQLTNVEANAAFHAAQHLREAIP